MNTPELEIPKEVTEAARVIMVWAAKNGHERWQLMGICGRRYAFALENVEEALARFKERTL